jgi:predicted transcriptional regulator
MLDELKLPKALAKRLEKAAATAHINPETIVKTAIKDRLDYLEWKENAIAEGQADLDSGKIFSTDHIRASLTRQRAQRAAKSKKAA